MQEEFLFYSGAPDDILIHTHIPERSNGHAFLFMNPIFDEKNRAQKFQAETARTLCQKGFQVIRFDYSGTGDSKGESYQLSGERIQSNLENLTHYLNKNLSYISLSILGIRFGADLAISWAEKNDHIEALHLIEPVFDGSKYISEQRLRRKMFQKVHGMDVQEESIDIGGEACEDFQGYLIAERTVKFIQGINSFKTQLSNKKLFLYKLDYLFSQKNYAAFQEKFRSFNEINCFNVQVEGFWEKLEMTRTEELTDQILNTVIHKANV